MGHLTRKYGLTIDNLVSVDMVLADGSFVVANAEENTDLFWAIRGGGGNFGIVTSFLFEAHPVGMVCAGAMLWNLEDAADVMKWYRELPRHDRVAQMTLMDGVTWVALVVAAFAALFTALQWKSAERSADAAEASAKAAKDSAETYKTALQTSQRAWLVFNPLDIEVVSMGAGHNPEHFYFSLENAGSSPAADW